MTVERARARTRSGSLTFEAGTGRAGSAIEFETGFAVPCRPTATVSTALGVDQSRLHNLENGIGDRHFAPLNLGNHVPRAI